MNFPAANHQRNVISAEQLFCSSLDEVHAVSLSDTGGSDTQRQLPPPRFFAALLFTLFPCTSCVVERTVHPKLDLLLRPMLTKFPFPSLGTESQAHYTVTRCSCGNTHTPLCSLHLRHFPGKSDKLLKCSVASRRESAFVCQK